MPHRKVENSTYYSALSAVVCFYPVQSKVAYHSKEVAGLTCQYANPPVPVREDLGAVMDVLKKTFNI